MVNCLYLAENVGSYQNPYLSVEQIMHYSGHNVGNFAFWNAARKIIDCDIKILPFGGKISLKSGFDLVIIPAANFLNETAELGWLADIIEEVDKPVLIFGLGAQSEHDDKIPKLKDGTLRFLQAVSKRTPYLALRGPYSEKVCREYGIENVKVLGCPSLFTNPDRKMGAHVEGAWKNPVEKMAIHASSIKQHVRSAERFLFSNLQIFPGSSYIVQRPMELMKIFRGIELNDKEREYIARIRKFLAPDLSDERFRNVLRSTGMIPYSVESWQFHLKTHSHSLGTRIHGAMMSLAAELPTICITHDTRTRELCSVMKVPAIGCAEVRSETSVSEIFEKITFSGDEFEQNRSEIAQGYDDLIKSAGFIPSHYMSSNFI